MQEEQEKSALTKWVIITVTVLFILAISIFLILRFAKGSSVATSIGGILPFGELSEETPRGTFEGERAAVNTPQNTDTPDESEKLFRQISEKETAGVTTITRGGKTFVRYVLRENGNVFEVDTASWKTRQLTNTIIPQIYEAYFAQNGNAVVLRYLDRTTGYDTIKTYLGEINLPENMASSSGAIGEIRGKYLPDNITAVSISPNGMKLFYLLSVADGSVGFVQSLDTNTTKELLRNTFSEWLPQLLDNETVVLTTKPSANIHGFSYLYNPKDKSMTRILREKNGLTTQSDAINDTVLFGENISGNATLGLYRAKGLSSEEGVAAHESPIALTSLPEKCVWSKGGATLYCASFTHSEKKSIPDEWYQGLLSFDDSFWAVNKTTGVVTFLGDPQEETGRDLDAIMPLVDEGEQFFFFIDKHTDFLWSMRITKRVVESEESYTPPTKEEAGDAAGSLP